MIKRAFLLLSLPLMLSACTVFCPALSPGETENAILAKYGTPMARYQDGDTTLLEYGSAYGQQKFMIRLDTGHRLISCRQVLTTDEFDAIRVGKDNMQSVLLRVGQPAETDYLALKGYTVWSYHYKEDGVWDSMMHIKFDADGIVRGKENGLDMLYLPR